MMNNTSNGMISAPSSSSSSANPQSPPEGKYKLHYEKTHPSGLLHYTHGKTVTQDTQLLLWDLEMDEIVVPLRRPPGGSPTYSTGSHSAHWDNVVPMGTLQPAPCMRDVPKLSPVVVHRVHTEPLSGLIFTPTRVQSLH